MTEKLSPAACFYFLHRADVYVPALGQVLGEAKRCSDAHILGSRRPTSRFYVALAIAEELLDYRPGPERAELTEKGRAALLFFKT